MSSCGALLMDASFLVDLDNDNAQPKARPFLRATRRDKEYMIGLWFHPRFVNQIGSPLRAAGLAL
jgi:hypothetical protein